MGRLYKYLDSAANAAIVGAATALGVDLALRILGTSLSEVFVIIGVHP